MATLSFQTVLSWESVEDFQERFVLSRFDSGGEKAVAWLCSDQLVIQKVLYNEKIVKMVLPCLPYLAGLIACEQEVEIQIDEVFEVQHALRSGSLDQKDAMDIIREKCKIIPIGACSIGIQSSLYFSAGGARPSVTIRSLRKSATSGKLYFGREGREAREIVYTSVCLSIYSSIRLLACSYVMPSFICIILGINLSPAEMVALLNFLKSPKGMVEFTAILSADKAAHEAKAAGNSLTRDNAE